MASDWNEDFLDLVDALNGEGVEYLVVGAFALALHGLPRATGITFEEAWASRVVRRIDGRDVTFVGRDPLLKNKRATGRPKDLADADTLERMKKR